MLSLEVAKLLPWEIVQKTDLRWRSIPFQKGGIAEASDQGLGRGTFQSVANCPVFLGEKLLAESRDGFKHRPQPDKLACLENQDLEEPLIRMLT